MPDHGAATMPLGRASRRQILNDRQRPKRGTGGTVCVARFTSLPGTFALCERWRTRARSPTRSRWRSPGRTKADQRIEPGPPADAGGLAMPVSSALVGQLRSEPARDLQVLADHAGHHLAGRPDPVKQPDALPDEVGGELLRAAALLRR